MDSRSLAAVVAVTVLLVTAGCAGVPAGGSVPADSESSPTGTETTSEQPRVSVVDADTGATLGTVRVEIADTRSERYTGLSEHESLGEDEGMLFVYGSEGEHDYVMRSMDFPIDIAFVGADGRITEVHHAQTESDNENLTRYGGRGQWVLEVPYEWTDEHGVEAGDRVVVPDEYA
jgi:uncharacterized membrane protein (UPF0127 family)